MPATRRAAHTAPRGHGTARQLPLVDGLGTGLMSIEAVIAERAIRTVFQPVVHLASGTVAGFEALTRGPAGSALESPLALLEAARLAGCLGELDWLCRVHGMQAAADAGLPQTLSWLVNVEPAGLAMDCPMHLRPALDRARADLRVILEVVERDLQGNVLELIQATDEARRDSWGVALDDVGADEASLALLPFLRPDVVKLDMSLVRGLPGARAAAITAGVRSYAERTGSVILAEGIETEEQERLAAVFGATYGQGYYYGRPAPLPATVTTASHPIPLRQHLPPLDGRTPFQILSRTLPVHRDTKEHLLHISSHLEGEAAQGSRASILLAGFQNKSFFTAEKQARYRELAADNALTIVLAEDLPTHDEPTYHVGSLPTGSRLGEEWVVIVLNVHYAAAFVARDCGDTAADGQRRFDFVYTHDRPSVINAARAFIQDLGVNAPAIAARHADARPAPTANTTTDLRPVATASARRHLAASVGAAAGPPIGFRAACQVVLDYLNAAMPMTVWSVTRVENDRQTFLYVADNDYDLTVGSSHPWQESLCINMVAGTAPRVAPDAQAVPIYAAASEKLAIEIGAYAGAPIAEPDGTLFGVICGLDRTPRHDLLQFGPILTVLSELLTLALASDRALDNAEFASKTALTFATTDSLTGIHNRRAWDDQIAALDLDFATYADPTVVVVIDLDNLKQVNDGPGGHRLGDQLLRSAADVMRRHIRSHDFLARLGGDEFGIILTACEATLAPSLVHRLNRALERAAIPASVGWAALRPDVTVRHAIDLADRAMFDAKKNRRLARARVK
jgi:diguanylate cyclase (GGDEF)-like protein